MLVFALGALDWSIEFCGCDDVALAFSSILTGWDVRITRQSPSARQLSGPVTRRFARISRDGQCYRWDSDDSPPPPMWRALEPRSPAEVVHDLHDVAIGWYLAANPGLLCLQAAAAEIDGALICFPGNDRSLNGVLMAAFAHAGARVFGDDVIAVDPAAGTAVALGCSPRLRRTPGPRHGDPLRRFVEQRRGAGDEHWAYLALFGNEIAGLGEQRRIDRMVFLDRAPNRDNRLHPLTKGKALEELAAGQTIAAGAAIRDLARDTRCFSLAFDTPEAVISALRHGPAASHSVLLPSRARSTRDRSGASSSRASRGIDPMATGSAEGTLLLARRPHAEEVDPTDRFTASLWRKLREAPDPEGLIGRVAAAFPKVDRPRIAADIARLVSDLTGRGLLENNESGTPSGELSSPPARTPASARTAPRSTA